MRNRRNAQPTRQRRNRPHGTWLVLALAFALWSVGVWADAEPAKIALDEQARTVVVRPDFVNEFRAGGISPPPGAVGTGVVFFGGQVGPYAVPNSGDEPVIPNAGGIHLADSIFGSPMATAVPYHAFVTHAIDVARTLLYYDDALGAGLTPSEAHTAFRYVDLLYGTTPESPDAVVNTIEARFNDMADFFGPEERANATEAERLLRQALAFAPMDTDLRNELLDQFYNRVRAETILAKERLVGTYHLRLEDPPPGGFVVDQEIEAYEEVLQLFRDAPTAYFELFQDPMGIDIPRDFDPNVADNAPFGYYMFREEVPGRSLFAATYRVPGKAGEPVPVLDVDGDGQPDLLLTGYKDVALLFEVLRDHADAAQELATRYVLRNAEGDIEQAQALIHEVLTWSYLHGTFLLGIFPEAQKSFTEMSGFPEQVQSWRHMLSELDAVTGFIEGNNNLLGFQSDFLMLVQADGAVFDSYDALASWNDPFNELAPSNIAEQRLIEARDQYDTFRGTLDQLFEQYDGQIDEFHARLFELVGATPGQAEYATPFTNPGSEINLQVTSIEVADLQIRKNQQEIRNLQEEVRIEIERRGREAGINNAIRQVYIAYGNRQAGLTESIALINGEQALAQNLADAAASVSVSAGFPGGVSVEVGGGLIAYTINAGVQMALEIDKGELEAQKERLAAMQDARIGALDDSLLDSNSRAYVMTLMLRMSTLAIESQEAALLLGQEWDRLAAFMREKERIERLIDESNAELIPRYYADPIHRLRFQSATVAAENAFKVAQKWLFFMVRAFEYKWNTPFMHATAGGRTFSINDVFRARNAIELLAVQAALADADMEMTGFDSSDDRFDWFSFREDFLGFMEGTTYYDPVTGEEQDAVTAFRAYLRQNTDSAGVLTLPFSTVRSDGTFFTGPIFEADGSMATPGLWNDKIYWITVSIPGDYPEGVDDAVLGALSYGGTSFVRNQFAGTSDPERPDRLGDEMTAWSTRYWFKRDGVWQFKEDQLATISINIIDNPLQPVSVNQINVFKERSVAATGWTLKIFLSEGGQQKIDIDDINDVELYFYHQAKNRISVKKHTGAADD